MTRRAIDTKVVEEVMAGKSVQLPLPEAGFIEVRRIGLTIVLREVPEDDRIKVPMTAGEGEATP